MPKRTPQRWMLVVASVVATSALLGVAWWITGPAPEPVGGDSPSTAPPVAMRDGAQYKALDTAIAQLQAGRTTQAARAFADLSAADPRAVEPQVGLVISRWSALGPKAVEDDLRQLAREYPDDPYPLLHIGLVRVYVGERRDAQRVLRQAKRLALQSAGDADLARQADNLLHPNLFLGYPPLVIDAKACATASCRRELARLAAAVVAGHRPAAARLAKASSGSVDWPVQAAAVVASYDKQAPEASVRQLRALLAQPGVDRPALQLQLAIVQIWTTHPQQGIAGLRVVADNQAAGRWRNQARAVLDGLAEQSIDGSKSPG